MNVHNDAVRDPGLTLGQDETTYYRPHEGQKLEHSWQYHGYSAFSSNVASGPDFRDPDQVLAQHEYAYSQLTEEHKKECSWQYHGYPALSRHMASGHDFLLVRKFSSTQVRCLLYMQNQINSLEKKLEAWDDYARKQPTGTGDSGCMLDDRFPERKKIIEHLIPKLNEYNNTVQSFASIRAMPMATSHHLRNMRNWFDTYPDAVVDFERHFQEKEDDIAPLVTGLKRSPLSRLLGQLPAVQQLFRRRPPSDKSEDSQSRHWDDETLGSFSAVLIILWGFGILLGPLWWLNFVHDHVHQLAIVTGFSGLFVICLWLATGDRPFETLAALAAYVAVLMIYRQVSDFLR